MRFNNDSDLTFKEHICYIVTLVFFVGHYEYDNKNKQFLLPPHDAGRTWAHQTFCASFRCLAKVQKWCCNLLESMPQSQFQ